MVERFEGRVNGHQLPAGGEEDPRQSGQLLGGVFGNGLRRVPADLDGFIEDEFLFRGQARAATSAKNRDASIDPKFWSVLVSPVRARDEGSPGSASPPGRLFCRSTPSRYPDCAFPRPGPSPFRACSGFPWFSGVEKTCGTRA